MNIEPSTSADPEVPRPAACDAGRGVSRRLAMVSLLGAGLSACGGGGSGTDRTREGGGGSGGGGGGGGGESYGGLRVSGQQIVDLQGAPVMLRGMNWGRWGLAQPQDAASNVAQGANCVRIPLRWWGLYSGDVDSRDDAATATARIDPGHLAILDQMISWASAAGLWIVLFIDSDCGQDGLQEADDVAFCDPGRRFPGGNNFWSNPGMRAQFIAAWKFVAARYRDTPRMGLFEPLPEPDPTAASSADITQFYAEAMSAIRGVAPGIPFLVGARSYNLYASSTAYDADWSDVVYTGDLFLYTYGTQDENIQNLGDRLQSLLNLRATKNVPIFVQQVGVQSGDDPTQVYLHAALSLLTTNGVGFAWWVYRDPQIVDSYGAVYLGADGTWMTKADVLPVISSYFNAP